VTARGIPARWGVAAAGSAVVIAALAAGVRMLPQPDPVLRVAPDAVLVAAPRPPSPPAGSPVGQIAVSPDWVSRTALTTGVPWPAVRAYGVATLRLARTDPGCHLSWTTLAGIGWVESQHGTIGGRRLLADGRPSRPIAGPALDGSGDLAAVGSSSGGWQRAIGPLQFLPSTWESWAADGDRDGATDPEDIDDAAYAAARYLCASGGDLATGVGWSAAVFSYNHSSDYVRAVYAAAQVYAVRAS